MGGIPQGFRVVSFDHALTGNRVFCQCHANAHESMLYEARERAPSYAQDSWPHRVIALLENATYSQDICHFCIAREYGQDFLPQWYGNAIQEHYGPYVDVLTRGSNLDLQTAKAETKGRLGINRWTREEELFQLIKQLFLHRRIQREASPRWLGRLRLDFYLPELALAIEHQGEQHYRPVNAFGGEGAFVKVQQRDRQKRLKCKEQGVSLVEVRFDYPLTLSNLRNRLKRWIVA